MYDICLIFLGDYRYDARILNLIKTLAKYEYKICIVSSAEQETSVSGDGSVDLITIDVIPTKRLRRKWYGFHKSVLRKMKDVEAKIFWASDLYSLPASVRLAKKSKAKVCYDSREIYSALGPLAAKPFRQKIIASIEKLYIDNVDHFIVSGNRDAVYLKKYFKTNKPFTTIMNLPVFKEIDNSDLLRDKFNIKKDKNILIYQGEILKGRGIAPVIKALHYLDNFVFCIIGKGPGKHYFEKLAEKKDINDKVIFTGPVHYEDLHRWTCSGDFGICLIEPVSLSYEFALPNKLFEYIMAGLPILATNILPIKDLLEKYKCGDLVKPDISPRKLAKKIKKLTESKDIYKENCILAAHKLHYDNQEEKIIGLVRSL